MQDDAPTLGYAGPRADRRPTSVWSVLSLATALAAVVIVAGIVTVGLRWFAVVPIAAACAVVTGVIGWRQTSPVRRVSLRVRRRTPGYAGLGMARAGFLVGLVMLGLSAVGFYLIRIVEKHYTQIHCMGNLRAIGQATRQYEIEHFRWPRNFAEVYGNKYREPTHFHCPLDPQMLLNGPPFQLGVSTSYHDLLPADPPADPATFVIAVCDGSNHRGQSNSGKDAVVLFADGRVRLVDDAELARLLLDRVKGARDEARP
jgi:hypothetical protein